MGNMLSGIIAWSQWCLICFTSDNVTCCKLAFMPMQNVGARPKQCTLCEKVCVSCGLISWVLSGQRCIKIHHPRHMLNLGSHVGSSSHLMRWDIKWSIMSRVSIWRQYLGFTLGYTVVYFSWPPVSSSESHLVTKIISYVFLVFLDNLLICLVLWFIKAKFWLTFQVPMTSKLYSMMKSFTSAELPLTSICWKWNLHSSRVLYKYYTMPLALAFPFNNLTEMTCLWVFS